VALRVRPLDLRASRTGYSPAVEIDLGESLEVAFPMGLPDVLRVSPHGAREIRIRLRDDDLAFLLDAGCAVLVAWAPVLLVRFFRHPHVGENPGQREGARIGAQLKILVAIEMGKRDAAVFGGPVRVDVLRGEELHAELLYGWVRGFRAKSGHAKGGAIVFLG